jgi:hypothetical protein
MRSPPLIPLAWPMVRAPRGPAFRARASAGPEPSFIISGERLTETLSLHPRVASKRSTSAGLPVPPRHAPLVNILLGPDLAFRSASRTIT